MGERPLVCVSHKLDTSANPKKRKAWTLTVGAHNEGCRPPVAPKLDVEIREGDIEKEKYIYNPESHNRFFILKTEASKHNAIICDELSSSVTL